MLSTLFQLKVNNYSVCAIWGFPSGSLVKNPPVMQEALESWVQSLVQEDPLEKEMATHSSIFAWRIPWTVSLEGYSP